MSKQLDFTYGMLASLQFAVNKLLLSSGCVELSEYMKKILKNFKRKKDFSSKEILFTLFTNVGPWKWKKLFKKN
jgi:hypothetical protein